ncbi:MAG: phosphoribosylformylglycinamidine synthase subunit PurL [Acidobacteria bacterium]|jgi:phosphoribosylformylglycinamidine synthase|nr:phosphoribosylformylglycinamidine synthase subunit PurL [Acidobacteriota bacterium]
MAEPKVTPELALAHGLNADEWERLCNILGRVPTYPELGIFSVMWSEHCSYKSSRIHLKKFPTSGPLVLQGPGENAGVVDIGDGWAVCFKMESHNHPSYIEPYQGAATGVGGILRDVFTMGARPIANLNGLFFGQPSHPKTPHLIKGVVAGIGDYGNCIGVPTVGGQVFFHPCYDGNILVNAFTLGLLRADKIFRGYASGVGNPVFYVGSKTGRDGIHGATMASAEFSDETEQKRPTVQVGDPFTEKLLLEACLELMEHDAIVGIQDMGAAGLTSSSFEMAGRAGSGIRIELDKVPMRETGMTPYEVLLSESQERMLIVAKAGAEESVKRVFTKWRLDAVVIGEVTDTGRAEIYWRGEKVVDMPVAPVSDQAPVYDRPQKEPSGLEERKRLDIEALRDCRNPEEALLRMMGSPNLCSRRWVYTQYDQSVRTNTVLGPGYDAALVRIKGTKKAVAMSLDVNPRYCRLDPYEGARLAVAEAARNVACTGARPLAITDCLNFGNPERESVMWEFARSVEGLASACRELDTPVVSGNVSFYNETNGEGIFPTPTVGMVGLLEDVGLRVQSFFEYAGDAVILLGRTRGHVEGSEYLSLIHGLEQGTPPPLDMAREKALLGLLQVLAKERLVHSMHDCSEGGLLVAVAECCLKPRGGDLGASISLQARGKRLDGLLFGEDASRVVASCSSESMQKIFDLARDRGLEATPIGTVIKERLQVLVDGQPMADISLRDLRARWEGGFPSLVSRV